MVYEYYLPVGGTSLACYCIEHVEGLYSEQRVEIWTKRLTMPAASVTKAVEAMALYAT